MTGNSSTQSRGLLVKRFKIEYQSYRYSVSVVPWCPGKQRKRNGMRAFPALISIRPSFAIKSKSEKLGDEEEVLVEHLPQADAKAFPVVAPRTFRANSSVFRPPRILEYSSTLFFDMLMKCQGACAWSGSALMEISRTTWQSRRCSIGRSSRGSGRSILNSMVALNWVRVVVLISRT
jgi:hypothetical protein